MITDKIINVDFLDENLIKIIPSIIVLDQDLMIKSVSMDVAKLLYYQPEEMLGCEILEILQPSDYSFLNSINELKRMGYFETKKISLLNRYSKEVSVEISGFYLGLLSDTSNSIILNVRDIDKLKTFQNLFNDKVSEFNELVYRTYHDLRGPVATVQGLLNIAKYNENDSDHDKTFKLIKESTDILNSRLANISAIFDSGYLDKSKIEDANFHSIEKIAQKLFKSQFPDHNVLFSLTVKEVTSSMVNNELLNSIFKNIILSISNSKTSKDDPTIKVNIQSFHNVVQIKCDLTGFNVDYSRYEKILNHEFNFSEIINDENLLRIYILNNQIQKHNGNIYSTIPDGNHWVIDIIIPKE